MTVKFCFNFLISYNIDVFGPQNVLTGSDQETEIFHPLRTILFWLKMKTKIVRLTRFLFKQVP